jgi:hypothetical protein
VTPGGRAVAARLGPGPAGPKNDFPTTNNRPSVCAAVYSCVACSLIMYAYRKSMPRANKVLEDKWVKHCQQLHRRKLKEMKSRVDTTPPMTTRRVHLLFLFFCACCNILESMETALILVVIFDRLVHLSNNLKRQQLDEERYSQIERENYLLLDKMSYIMTHPQLLDEKYMGAPVTYGKSLNKEFRKRELMRITEENQVIFKPTYCVRVHSGF